MTPFHLLRLPVLAIEEVLRSLTDLMDRNRLSETSKRTQRIVIDFHRTSSFHFFVAFQEDCFLAGVDFSPEWNTGLQFSGRSDFSENFMDDYKRTMDKISKVFRKPALNLVLSNMTSEFIEEMMSHIEGMELKYTFLSINTRTLSKNLLEKILKNYMYKGLKTLKIQMETCPDIEYNPQEPFQVTELEIHHCHWLRPQHLNLFHNSIRIILPGLNLSSIDFVDFLTQWCQDSKLESVQIGYNGESLEILSEKVPSATPIEQVRLFGRTVQFSPGRAYVLQQNNGRRGCAYRIGKGFFLATKFEVVNDPAQEVILL